MMLKPKVVSEPTVTASTCQKKHPELFKDVSIRIIQHPLRKDLGSPTRRTTVKPLFSKAMKEREKKNQFCKTLDTIRLEENEAE